MITLTLHLFRALGSPTHKFASGILCFESDHALVTGLLFICDCCQDEWRSWWRRMWRVSKSILSVVCICKFRRRYGSLQLTLKYCRSRRHKSCIGNIRCTQSISERPYPVIRMSSKFFTVLLNPALKISPSYLEDPVLFEHKQSASQYWFLGAAWQPTTHKLDSALILR